eukprot:CAMPEP_0181527224 /NCGR_PEP_ID=MMETSP1110-20121109/69896_1 /TAXON_ID=174948 /ORGANISM="Symbiodinium sp., Strain CCMP421" /LENGTH=72 /DNA_ID=CAMNT_0023658099 /DNA_START=372 /DNA_END=588 /DNA_ORIENTATION=-
MTSTWFRTNLEGIDLTAKTEDDGLGSSVSTQSFNEPAPDSNFHEGLHDLSKSSLVLEVRASTDGEDLTAHLS